MIADILGQIVFELLGWPAAALWPRLTRNAQNHEPATRFVLKTCAVVVIIGVYILAIAVIVGAVLLITGAV